MSGLEQYEEITRLRAEVMEKDARIAELEAALQEIRGIERVSLDENCSPYIEYDGEWIAAGRVYRIIEDVLR